VSAAWRRHMRRGEFEAAWTIGDRDLGQPREADAFTRPRHQQRIWDGQPIDGRRVLVRCYHGLGDTIQFARFLPVLAARAASVVVWAQPALIPLLRTIDAPLRFEPLHDGVPDVGHDVDVEVMELAWLLRITPAALPAGVPYLRVASEPRDVAAARTIGVVWRGGDWDPARSLPASTMSRLVDVPGVRCVAFDPRPTGADRAGWRGAWRPIDDLVRLARAFRACDLIVTVDTMAAHLAGALGVPVWTLLSSDPDWRWMEDRNDSPWYPTMRLFRRDAGASWDPVVDAVASALARGGTR
jgi:hypothetical protein